MIPALVLGGHYRSNAKSEQADSLSFVSSISAESTNLELCPAAGVSLAEKLQAYPSRS